MSKINLFSFEEMFFLNICDAISLKKTLGFVSTGKNIYVVVFRSNGKYLFGFAQQTKILALCFYFLLTE